MANCAALIIGVTGQIGSAVASVLAREGISVFGIARTRRYVPAEYIHVHCDRRSSPNALAEALRISGAPLRWRMVIDCCFQSVADLPSLQSLCTERVIVMSSGSVYDHRQPLPIGEDGQLVVDQQSAISAHSWARQLERRLADHAVQDWAIHSNISLALFRLGVVVGVRDRSNRLGWWLRRSQGQDRLVVPNDAMVSLVDARDVAEFVATRLRAHEPRGVFNISGRSVALLKIVETLCNSVGIVPRLDLQSSKTLMLAGAVPWTEVPLWAVPGSAADRLMHALDCRKAEAAGFKRRLWSETIAHIGRAEVDGCI